MYTQYQGQGSNHDDDNDDGDGEAGAIDSTQPHLMNIHTNDPEIKTIFKIFKI